MIGPVRMDVVNDRFTQGCRINAIIWEGTTVSGDIAELSCPGTGARIWRGRTDGTQTYLGANFGECGVPAPYGFRLTQLSNGAVYVYLRED